MVDHLAEWIIGEFSHGVNATTICREVGLCSSQGCDCGECSSVSAAQGRCLRVPHRCPSSNPLLAASQERSPVEVVPKSEKPVDTEFCVDGVCDDSTIGCCLTCW